MTRRIYPPRWWHRWQLLVYAPTGARIDDGFYFITRRAVEREADRISVHGIYVHVRRLPS